MGEAMSQKHCERMRFYLSKADEAGHESDRQRVMMQIVQELCKRPGLNRTGFDMPTIYIPNPNKQVRCVNQIDDVCREIATTLAPRSIWLSLRTIHLDLIICGLGPRVLVIYLLVYYSLSRSCSMFWPHHSRTNSSRAF